jgi:hypothetical protein
VPLARCLGVARWPVLCDAAQLAPLAVAGAEPVADGGGAAVGLAGGDGRRGRDARGSGAGIEPANRPVNRRRR